MSNKSLFGDQSIVPMVMFHTVGTENMDWEYHHIAEPIEKFEAKISALYKAGFNFIFWEELYNYMSGKCEIELPAIVLTFDDGYLDNWVYVYPILKRYGAKGTIFMSTDFVDPSHQCRPNLDDVHAGKLTEDELRIDGFLNWEEMREMEKSGLIDIQSHTKTHTWYFNSEKVIDFWTPFQNENIWMAWNIRPDRKAFYLSESQWNYVPVGTPIYEHEKSLMVTQVFPNAEIAEQMCTYVQQYGGDDFFKNADWKDKLMEMHLQISGKLSDTSRVESADARRARMMDELIGSKEIIEKELGKKVEYICWPGGGYINETMSLAKDAGYKSWTLSSRDNSAFRNIPGADPVQVKRIGSSPRQFWRGKDLGFTNGAEFLCHVRNHQGSTWHKWKGRVFKVMRLLGFRG